jgi:hypothetical protein
MMKWKDLGWSKGGLVKQHPGICLEGLRKTTINLTITAVSAEIRNGYFQNYN